MNPGYICDACGAFFTDSRCAREQLEDWKYRCPCNEGTLHKNGVKRVQPATDVEDRLSRLVIRLYAKSRAKSRDLRIVQRQLDATRRAVATMAEYALSSEDPEAWKRALLQLVAQGRMLRLIETTKENQ